MIINNKNYKFINSVICLNCPAPDLIKLTFKVGDIDTYDVILNFEKAKEFYERWNSHREIYVELCKDLGVSEDLIPEDIESEAELTI